MDKSKLYIKMCDCEEIQSLKPSTVYKNFWGGINPMDCIWLPRQDQLQGMITKNGYFRFSLIELFNKFCNSIYQSTPEDARIMPHHIFDSMEKFWLAHVMKLKHKKRWIDEKWEVV